MSIDDIVEETIKKLEEVFDVSPTKFFTEDDVVQYFYHLLMTDESLFISEDMNGYEHLRIHKEFPTPFRCSMANKGFEFRDNDSGVSRGHIDLVILNEDFISKYDYYNIKSQDNINFQKIIKKDYNQSIVDYAFEFMFFRKTVRLYKRGGDTGITDEVKMIIQDHEKIYTGKTGVNNRYQNIRNIKSIICAERFDEDIIEYFQEVYPEYIDDIVFIQFNKSKFNKMNDRTSKYRY